jgi:hypothetical protein
MKNLLITGRSLLIWISDEHAEGDKVNSILIRQKAQHISDSLNTSEENIVRFDFLQIMAGLINSDGGVIQPSRNKT